MFYGTYEAVKNSGSIGTVKDELVSDHTGCCKWKGRSPKKNSILAIRDCYLIVAKIEFSFNKCLK